MDYDKTPNGHKRIAAIVAAGATALLSLGFLGTGATLLWADSEADKQGYISTGSERFSSSGHALATDNLDIELDGPEALLDEAAGKLRVEADAHGDKPVFVGIAPTNEVDEYLRGSAHDLVTDVDFSPFEADYSTRDGSATPAPPAQERFWAATAQGAGDQSLTWDVEDGDWSVVVMNADGSRGVDADVGAGVRISWLDDAGLVSLTTGFVLLVLAGGLVYLAVRTRAGTAAVA
jgi:hypothetical protein